MQPLECFLTPCGTASALSMCGADPFLKVLTKYKFWGFLIAQSDCPCILVCMQLFDQDVLYFDISREASNVRYTISMSCFGLVYNSRGRFPTPCNNVRF